MPETRRGPGADLLLSLGILAAAGATLALTGCTAAPAAPPDRSAASPGTVTMRSAADAKPGEGQVHLADYTDNDGPDSRVILTGAIGDYGEAVSVNPDGSVNPDHDGQLELRLSHGSFRLDIAALDKAFVSAFAARFPTNAGTCSGFVAASRPVPIVAGSGTGAYRGVSGRFDLTTTADEVDPTSTKCDGTAPYLGQMLITAGFGDVQAR